MTTKIREIRAQLDAIAPLPEDGAVTAKSLAEHFAVRAQERFTRMLHPLAEVEQVQVSAMCAEFAAAHALIALDACRSRSGNLTAAQIRDAICDGGGVGEWLWEHLGGETSARVAALAEQMAEAQAGAAATADEDSGDADDGRVTVSRALHACALRDAIRICQAEATNGDPEAPEILAEYEAALIEVTANA